MTSKLKVVFDQFYNPSCCCCYVSLLLKPKRNKNENVVDKDKLHFSAMTFAAATFKKHFLEPKKQKQNEKTD